MRQLLFLGCFICSLCHFFFIEVCYATAQPQADSILYLWPESAPGLNGGSELDKPAMSVFLPEKKEGMKTGVVIFPGGGYSHLAMEKEGYKVAEWLNGLGISAFVVRYRLGMRHHHPHQLEDAQRAVRLARYFANDQNLALDHIGVLGFSAGGHLASSVGTHFDMGRQHAVNTVGSLSSRPDFMILIYPVITMQDDYTHEGSRRHLLGEAPDQHLISLLSSELQVSADTPPAFLVHGTNDTAVPVENSLQFYTALRNHNVSAEMHLFEDGPHGFGLAPEDPELSQWTTLCAKWLASKGFLKK